MDLAPIRVRLARNRDTIRSLLEEVDEDRARWRPDPGSWSILEVVNHLHDEEREDFRRRIDLTLHHPGEPWPAIDPVGWVTARNYQARDLEESVNRFLREREVSLAWLAELVDPDWNRAYDHPRAGPLRAGDLVVSWLGHDFLHLRQLSRLHFAYLRETGFSTDYSGGW